MENNRGDQQTTDLYSSEIATDNRKVVIPVIEETAFLDKKIVESGKIRVIKTVSEREETIDEPLFREEVSIERVPLNQYVDSAPPVRQEGDVMIIPVVQEQLVMQKRLVLIEELRVTKKVVETHQPQTVVLRREQVDVQRIVEAENFGD